MSFIGGLLAVPLYLIMNFMSLSKETIDTKHPPVSFLGIIESIRYPLKYHFYEQMFGNRWENIALILAISVLYLLKPLFTTRFILSLSPPYTSLSYIATEVFAKSFIVFIALICFEKETNIPKL